MNPKRCRHSNLRHVDRSGISLDLWKATSLSLDRSERCLDRCCRFAVPLHGMLGISFPPGARVGGHLPSPRTQNACKLAGWQARHNVPNRAMRDLMDNVLPKMDLAHLPTWSQMAELVADASADAEPSNHTRKHKHGHLLADG